MKTIGIVILIIGLIYFVVCIIWMACLIHKIKDAREHHHHHHHHHNEGSVPIIYGPPNGNLTQNPYYPGAPPPGSPMYPPKYPQQQVTAFPPGSPSQAPLYQPGQYPPQGNYYPPGGPQYPPRPMYPPNAQAPGMGPPMGTPMQNYNAQPNGPQPYNPQQYGPPINSPMYNPNNPMMNNPNARPIGPPIYNSNAPPIGPPAQAQPNPQTIIIANEGQNADQAHMIVVSQPGAQNQQIIEVKPEEKK